MESVCACVHKWRIMFAARRTMEEEMVILLDGISFNRKLRRIMLFLSSYFSVYPASESMVAAPCSHAALALIRTNKSNIAHAHSCLGIYITIIIMPIIRLLFCLEPSNLFPFWVRLDGLFHVSSHSRSYNKRIVKNTKRNVFVFTVCDDRKRQ